MQIYPRTTQRGFSLVELLAVVLILSVLAAVAVPLYLNSRKNAAARTCSGNVAAIAAAESAFATRFGHYTTDITANYSGTTGYKGKPKHANVTLPAQAVAVGFYSHASTTGGATTYDGLLGAPEGLSEIPACPLSGDVYAVAQVTGTNDIEIICPSADIHGTDTGTTDLSPWDTTLKAAGNDATNRF